MSKANGNQNQPQDAKSLRIVFLQPQPISTKLTAEHMVGLELIDCFSLYTCYYPMMTRAILEIRRILQPKEGSITCWGCGGHTAVMEEEPECEHSFSK